MTDPTSSPIPPGRKRPRLSVRTWLRLAWSVGRLIVSGLSLILASFTAALEVSYRIMIAFTEWRTFIVSNAASIAMFLALFAAIWAGLLWIIWRYAMSLADRIADRIRVDRGLDSPAADPHAEPFSTHHFDQEPAR